MRFPAECTIHFHFLPEQPFGLAAGGGRTVVRAVAASILVNANTGEQVIESKQPLAPLDVTLQEPARIVQLTGRTLSISEKVESLRELEDLIMSIFFGFPILLNVPFADPPFIERVDGSVGSTTFRWELSDWHMQYRTTTQDQQENSVVKAWERMGILAESHRRRLIAGLHYFHLACRLARAGRTAGEFVAEVILNLAKALEVVFPPGGDGLSREAVRAGSELWVSLKRSRWRLPTGNSLAKRNRCGSCGTRPFYNGPIKGHSRVY